ncbi:MAG TPA: hypothetical protein VGO47_01770, partial [Chlamydiales bacterium]|nr:hypothetical protein [Chlamydiales bacterium]
MGLSSLLQEEAELLTDGDEAGQWNIYKSKRITQRSYDTHTWRLCGGNAKLYDEAMPLVKKEIEQAGERVRFGVLTLFAEQMPLVKNGIYTLIKTDSFEEEMVWQLEPTKSGDSDLKRLIIAGMLMVFI